MHLFVQKSGGGEEIVKCLCIQLHILCMTIIIIYMNTPIILEHLHIHECTHLINEFTHIMHEYTHDLHVYTHQNTSTSLLKLVCKKQRTDFKASLCRVNLGASGN